MKREGGQMRIIDEQASAQRAAGVVERTAKTRLELKLKTVRDEEEIPKGFPLEMD